MSEIIIPEMSTDLQQNLSSDITNLSSDTNETPGTHNPVSDLNITDEPPTKKCKITSNDKPRLLEDRISSILSCCICLDLSTLPIYQVSILRFVFKLINILCFS